MIKKLFVWIFIFSIIFKQILTDLICQQNKSKEKCDQNDDCIWEIDPKQVKCQNKQINCSQTTDKQECNNNFKCFYEEGKKGYCYNKSSFDCNQNDIKSCNKEPCVWRSYQEYEKKDESSIKQFCDKQKNKIDCDNNSSFCQTTQKCQLKENADNFCKLSKKDCNETTKCEYVISQVDKCQIIDDICNTQYRDQCNQNSEVCKFEETNISQCLDYQTGICSTKTKIEECKSSLDFCNFQIVDSLCASKDKDGKQGNPCLQINKDSCNGDCFWDETIKRCNKKDDGDKCIKIKDFSECNSDCQVTQIFNCTDKSISLCSNLSSDDCQLQSDYCDYTYIKEICVAQNDQCYLNKSSQNCLAQTDCQWDNSQSICTSQNPLSTFCQSIQEQDGVFPKDSCNQQPNCISRVIYNCKIKSKGYCSKIPLEKCKSSFPYCYYKKATGNCKRNDKDPCDGKDKQSCLESSQSCILKYEQGECKVSKKIDCDKLTETECSKYDICEYKFSDCLVKNTEFCIDKTEKDFNEQNQIPCQKSSQGFCTINSFECSSILNEDECVNDEKNKKQCEWKQQKKSKCREAFDCNALNEQQCESTTHYCDLIKEFSCIPKSQSSSKLTSIINLILFSFAYILIQLY